MSREQRKTVTAKEMARLERLAVKKYGIPTRILMENAGRSVAEAVLLFAGKKKKRVLVVCGKGNNGGDGFVAARHLKNKGFDVQVALYAKAKSLPQDPLSNYTIARRMGVRIRSYPRGRALRKLLTRADVIVDALFGTGLTRDLTGEYIHIVEEINHRERGIVVAVDIPSGVDADNGVILGAAVRADLTVSLGFHKRGVTRGAGPRLAGRCIIGDISMPIDI